MRGHARKFRSDAVEHIYQRTIHQVVMFYCLADRLVFYTIFSVTARKFKVVILALALMFDHFHCIIAVAVSRLMALFVGTVTSTFARAFNRETGRKGPLFCKAYGNSVKSGDKKIRTGLAYNFNNSAEKGLFDKAEEDRWNLLAYLNSDHPFSEEIQYSMASQELLSALSVVRSDFDACKYLTYKRIYSIYEGLSAKETEQLTDFIISLYLPVDKERLLSYYKDYDSMVLAINSNTGSEYDIKEEYDPASHRDFQQMVSLLSKSSFAERPNRIVTAPLEEKLKIAKYLQANLNTSRNHICRFLHLPME